MFRFSWLSGSFGRHRNSSDVTPTNVGDQRLLRKGTKLGSTRPISRWRAYRRLHEPMHRPVRHYRGYRPQRRSVETTKVHDDSPRVSLVLACTLCARTGPYWTRPGSASPAWGGRVRYRCYFESEDKGRSCVLASRVGGWVDHGGTL